jgi:putative FmdB family regulatory protein
MPIYEYRCQACNEVSEAFVRSGKEPTACPECGAEELKRLISRAGIIFKGSGFYVTDSKASSNSGGKSGDSKSSGSGDSKSSDSKSSDSSSKSDSGSSDSSSKSTASTD